MSLSPGDRLGPYQIVGPLGAGGMGEVYRGRDTRLDRTVAIKILSPEIASGPELRERFEREARAIASLNHPYICTLHDVGRHEGTDYLVMEYLEGETLEQRLRGRAGPLGPAGEPGPKGHGLHVDEALQIGIQIADALAAAHAAGIVHRDLKPGNVVLTKSGSGHQGGVQAKLLDFGLARTGVQPIAGSLSMLPTTPPNLTAQGTILGTFQYMAPEQLEGQEADARTDIFAFGAVLYEMLTGRKAFEGKSQASLIGAILKDTPPPPSKAQPLAPARLDAIVGRCLAKDPGERWQSAADLLFSLRTLDEAAAVPVAPVSNRRARPVVLLGLSAALVTLGLTGSLAVRHLREVPPRPQTVQFAIAAPTGAVFTDNNIGSGPAISPDGRRVAFVARGGDGQVAMWVRDLGSEQARPLPGGAAGTGAFWSPDSRSLAYFDGPSLMRVDMSGGAPHLLVEAPESAGGTWNRDDVILIGSDRGGIRRLRSGTSLEEITRPDSSGPDTSHRFPRFLPDGVHFLFYGSPSQSIYVGSLDDGESPRRLDVVTDSFATYAMSGHLLFSRGGVLFAQPFDVPQLRTMGGALAVAQNVTLGVNALGSTPLSVSETGTLTQFVGPTMLRQLAWFDRRGARLGTLGEPARFRQVTLSPGDARVAADVFDERAGAHDIWLVDAERGVASRITADPVNEGEPTWSPDGNRLVFLRTSERGFQVVEKTLTTGAERIASESPDMARPEAWSRDGQFLLHSGGLGLFAMPLQQPDNPELFVNLPGSEDEPEFSPDGRWVAFNSSESGRPEVYVQPFQRPGERIRISDRGGMQPHWRADGRELFYLTQDSDVVSVDVVLGAAEIKIGRSTRLFTLPITPNAFLNEYAVSSDGQRFLMSVPVEGGEPARILVTLNWAAALTSRPRP